MFQPYEHAFFAFRSFFRSVIGWRLIPRENLRRWRARNKFIKSSFCMSTSFSKSMPRYAYLTPRVRVAYVLQGMFIVCFSGCFSFQGVIHAFRKALIREAETTSDPGDLLSARHSMVSQALCSELAEGALLGLLLGAHSTAFFTRWSLDATTQTLMRIRSHNTTAS